MNNYYSEIIGDIFNTIKNDTEVLFLIENEYNILDKYSHIIKKKNIKVNFLINNFNYFNNMNKNIKGEECESNVKIYKDLTMIDNKKLDLFVIFNLNSIEETDNILLNIKDIFNDNFNIHIYSSLCKEINKINFKNKIRDKIINYTDTNIGYTLQYFDVLNIINKYYKINFIQIYKKNSYIIYGANTIYKIILENK